MFKTKKTKPFVVLKFGGTSVSNLQCWRTIASIIQERLQEEVRPLIVCSAIRGISDGLEQLIVDAINGDFAQVLQTIVSRHHELSEELNVDADTILSDDFVALQQLATGISLVKEASPRIRAKVMAYGELMLTRLGAVYLAKQNISCQWMNASDILRVVDYPDANNSKRYLAANCNDDYDEQLNAALKQQTKDVILTQGFIASNLDGETVLLGRGGSDTSAAYFAAKLTAKRCEIWTDVAGIYTANPRLIPEARLLTALAYDEAQEIASVGAKVLHPPCITPLCNQSIPLFIKQLKRPDLAGTVISSDAPQKAAQVKAIVSRYGVVLIVMETNHMWQQAGFLATVFDYFKKRGVSIDLVSTSETNVTVSLDVIDGGYDKKVLDALLKDISAYCQPRIIEGCAAISLVGNNIRSIIYRLGSALKVFEEQKIHLISQAASDLNLTFIVDESQAERLTRDLHALIFEEELQSELFAESWQQQLTGDLERKLFWWETSQKKLLTLTGKNSPVYVYDETTLKNAATELLSMQSLDQAFYAIKANSHPDILKCFYEMGLGFECVSLNEVEYVIDLLQGIDPKKIMFTPNFAPKSEYQKALKLGVNLTIDSIYPLANWSNLFKNQDIFIRINPGYGRGHHKHVTTGGMESKFGIAETQFEELIQLVDAAKVNVVGLHAHSGSGILVADNWKQLALYLVNLLEHFPQVKILNLGGGLGVVEKPGQNPLPISQVDESLFHVKQSYPHLKFWMEPGRFLVANAGVLLATVTQVKKRGSINFVGIDTGMNSLIRPALYGAYHEIVNLSRLNESREQVANIVGPICESADTLGFSRHIAAAQEGDVILIANTGAYGKVMSSTYNMRAPANEFYMAF